MSALSSTDRASGFGPEDEGSTPSERATESEAAGPHDYYIVATMHLHHYATYEEAVAAKAEARAMMAASSKGKTRRRAEQLRIYRCHSFGRICSEKPHDGSGFVRVPLAPTEAMIDAAFTDSDDAEATWKEMIAARPVKASPPPQGS